MHRYLAGIMLCLVASTAVGAEQRLMPEWAYPTAPAGGGGDDGGGGVEPLVSVPGSTRQLRPSQTSPFFGTPQDGGIEDWFPERHGPMPDAVRYGRRPDVRACASCHLTSGQGHATSGMVAGMNPDYFFQQVKDYAEGKRSAIDPGRTAGMVRIARAVTDEEIREAAEYYARQTPVPWVRIIEAEVSPVTVIGDGLMRKVKPDGGTEPLGQRVVEVPADQARSDLDDPYSGYVAYVPVGSVEKGDRLVATGGGGKTIACSICHGADLKGLGAVPGIAGRLPTYLARQMFDMKHGSRNGEGAALMRSAVTNLTEEDVINIVAYLGTLPP